MSTHPHYKRLRRLDTLARRMDSALTIPVINRRIGWDPIVGIIPVLGDTIMLAPTAWIMLESRRMGVPVSVTIKQAANALIDYGIGSIPLIGVIFDAGWRANLRNVDLLRRHLEAQHGPEAAEDGPDPVDEARLKDITPDR